jgi:hypothetical protein
VLNPNDELFKYFRLKFGYNFENNREIYIATRFFMTKGKEFPSRLKWDKFFAGVDANV